MRRHAPRPGLGRPPDAQLALGVANGWLLAPTGIQIAHLLLSDLIWIALVLLAARALADRPSAGAPAVSAARRPQST